MTRETGERERANVHESAGNEAAEESGSERSDFVREMIRRDLREGKYDRVTTRFPPEPNGYLHIGHAKSIVLNFGVAEEFGGRCHLRFDDTNPETEEEEYAESIKRDIKWLGYDWGEHLYHASDYFELFYGYAVELIEKGLAYVDSQSEEEIRRTRGTVTEPGVNSPYRNRSVEENLDLLARMRAGEFPDGAHVLRAKIDMSAANMKMRDPLLYRIRNLSHFRTGDAWHIYPMYDFAHCLEDAIERISHSLCTLEFENNRPIYDWILENVSIERPRPYQTEFARLAITYTVMSKRKLLLLVKKGHVEGWDDPRMPTLAGMRRRGYTPEAIRGFCEEVGVAKTNATVEIERLEHAVRDDLNARAPRMMGVLRPLKLVVESWPEGETEWLDAPLWPHDVPKEGSRKLPFTRELLIEQDDFAKEPPKGFRRLSPGAKVRLRHAYVIECTGVVEDEQGRPVEVRAVHLPEGSGKAKVKGAIHWVSATESIEVPVRIYGRLFTEAYPESDPERSFEELLDPASLELLHAKVEPEIGKLEGGRHVQLERQGYFYVDHEDARRGSLVLNRTVPLRDSWAKVAARAGTVGAAREAPGGHTTAAPPVQAERGPPREAPLEPAALRLKERYGVSDHEARTLGSRPEVARFFEQARARTSAASLARWVANDLVALLKGRSLESLPFGPAAFADMVSMVDERRITATAGKVVLEEMAGTGEAPEEIVERVGLAAASDGAALDSVAAEIVDSYPEEASRYRAGKKGLIGFFVGKVMERAGKGVDPKAAREALERRLAAGT